MDTFDSSAIALQKNLLNLRQQRDEMRAKGNDAGADQLDPIIAGIQKTLERLQGGCKPPTLQ